MNKNYRRISIFSLAVSFTTLISLNMILPSYITYLGGDITIIGLVYSLRSLIKPFFRILSGISSIKHNKKIMLMIGLLIKSIGFYVLFISSNLVQVVLGVTLLSSSVGLIEPIYQSGVADFLTESSAIATGFGLGFAIRSSPSIISNIFTGFVADNFDIRNIFLIGFTLSLISILFIFKIKFISTRSSTETSSLKYSEDLKKILNKKFILLLCTYLFLFIGGRGSFDPIFSYWIIEKLGYNYTILGFIFSSGAFIGLFSKVYTGYLSDKFGHINISIIAGLLRILSMLLMIFTKNPILIALLWILRILLVCRPPRQALIFNLNTPETYTLAYGIMGLTSDIGHILGPLIMGYMVDVYGFEAGFLGIAFLLGIFVFGLYILKIEFSRQEKK